MELTSEIIAGVYLMGPPAQMRYGNPLENPNLPLNNPDVWESVFGTSFNSDSGISVTAERAMMYAPLYRGIQLIAGDVAKLSRPVYKRRPDIGDDARERDRGHRLNYVLNVAPNPETEAIKFWCRFMADALLYSNAYARIYFDGSGQAAELYSLLPDRTHAEYIDGQLWYVTEVDGKLHALYPWEVLHIEGLQLSGMAMQLFRMARNSIALGLAQEKFASKFFANGGRIGGILELPAGMPKPSRDTVEEGFRKTYEGGENPFKTVVLRDNAKFHAAQQSPVDSQLVEASEAQTRAIAHWLNLPPSKLGLSDSVSYNSKAEDNQNYLDTTLQIWLTRIESACNFRLISDRQQDSYFVEHNTSGLLRMNLQAQSDAFQKLIAARVMNPNEARAKLNMLPYEGGDEFVNPNTMKSGNDTGAGAADATKEEPADDAPPKRSASYLRTMFGITARARDKAKRPKAFLEWIDGNLQPHRDEWRQTSQEAFPFEELLTKFKQSAEHYTDDKLPIGIEALCKEIENGT